MEEKVTRSLQDAKPQSGRRFSLTVTLPLVVLFCLALITFVADDISGGERSHQRADNTGQQASGGAHRLRLSPSLRAGQIFTYQIVYRTETHTKTESNVASPMAPSGGETDEHLLLRCEVVEVRAEGRGSAIRMRSRIVEPPGIPSNTSVGGDSSGKARNKAKEVNFTLHANGQLSDLTGMDALSQEQQSAWQEWVDRFGDAAAYPANGVKQGEKWKSEEAIPQAALAQLYWEKESHYVSNAPCKQLRTTAQGDLVEEDQASDTCAVILTTARLRQKSSPTDASPEDFKLHDLRTMGTAKGTNEIISYISLKTGLVVRATEEAKQSMNVVVAKADGTNRVQYNINAESHAEVLLVSGAPPNAH